MHDPLSKESVLDVLQALVRTPSVNPTLAPDENGSEEAVARVAQQWLEAHGVRAWVDEVAPGRFNAVGEIGAGERTLVLCGHIDTVGTTGMTIPPFEPTVEHGRVYGRGSLDMKGGVASIMSAMAALAREPLQGRVLAALVADEEYASVGAEHFAARYPAHACILTEPNPGGLGDLVLAHKGFVWLRITTHGSAAHGSRWDLGRSAITAMGRVITALDDLDRNVLRQRTHPLTGPASMHAAVVGGGSGWSTYAAECRLDVERRTIPGEVVDEVVAEMRGVVAATGVAADIEVVFAREPMTCAADAPIASCARAALAAVTGGTPRDAGVGYWMDAAVFAAKGLDVVDVGGRGEGAHEPVEWVDLQSVVDTAHVLVHAVRAYLSAGSDRSAAADAAAV